MPAGCSGATRASFQNANKTNRIDMVKEQNKRPAITIGDSYQDQDNRTWREVVLYNGATVIVRSLVDKNGVTQLIADDELFDILHPGSWDDKKTEGFDPTDPQGAEEAYNEIFFFTDCVTLRYSDEELYAEMVYENPEYFQ